MTLEARKQHAAKRRRPSENGRAQNTRRKAGGERRKREAARRKLRCPKASRLHFIVLPGARQCRRGLLLARARSQLHRWRAKNARKGRRLILPLCAAKQAGSVFALSQPTRAQIRVSEDACAAFLSALLEPRTCIAQGLRNCPNGAGFDRGSTHLFGGESAGTMGRHQRHG